MRASQDQILLHACGTGVLIKLHEKQKLLDLLLLNFLYRVATPSCSS